ncbi:MAG: 5'-methylthioadenosine/S-adenosylhomocysteine nucleosidase [Oscillospiraceae bacterium]|nr:5'-methylthioadenosine/S-adenosylhomocysteine nucleosidase [Oscillospiraceae bacterium]
MKTIGMLVAVEIKAVLDRFGDSLCEKEVAGYRVLEYKTPNYNLIIAKCGAGEIAAAGGTQFLISEYKVDMIINFGVVGGLTPEMAKTKTCVVEKVVHYDFDTSAVDNVEVGRYLEYPDVYIPATKALVDKALSLNPDLMPVICASADKFVAEPQQKINLNKQFGAHICEMEAAGIVLICNRNNVPCLLIKSVSDSIEGGADEFWSTVNEAAAMCLDIVNEIIKEL